MSLTFEEYVKRAHEKGYSSQEIADQVDLLKERGYFDAKSDGLDLSEEIPQVTDMDAYTSTVRDSLQEELDKLNAERDAAQGRVEFAEKPAYEQAYAGLAQAGQAGAEFLARPVLDAPAAVWNTLLREEGQPTLEGILPELGRGDYVPEGTPGREAVEAGATMMTLPLGFTPVARAAGSGRSVLSDVFGMGMTDEAMAVPGVMAARNATLPAAAQAPELTGLQRDKSMMDFNNDVMVQDAVNDLNINVAADVNPGLANRYQEVEQTYQNSMESAAKILDPRKQAKAEAKALKKRKERLDELEKRAAGDLRQAHTFGEEHTNSVIQAFARAYDMPVAEAAGIVYRSGGVDSPNSFIELMGRRNKQLSEELFSSTRDRRAASRLERGLDPNKYDKPTFAAIEEWIRPAIGLIRDNIGVGMANKTEAAMVRGAAQRDHLVQKYTEMQTSVQQVADWANTPAVKRQFMNLNRTGVEGRARLIGQARQTLDADAFQTFMEMIDDTFANQKNWQRHLMRDSEKKDAVHWGIGKNMDRPAPGTSEATAARAGSNDPSTVAPLAKRTRKDADKMTDEELAEYDNPIWSNMQQLFDSQDMVELSKALNVPPGMRIGDGLQDYVRLLTRHIAQTTGDMDKANNAAKIMDSVIVGSRKNVGPWQQAFMNQAYAGALGHVKSALLQTHDHFITAWRTGPIETLQAMFERGGVRAADFGLSTNAFNTREFREGLDAGFNAMMRGTETPGEKAARKTATLAQEIFKRSGFQALDRWGKGTNLKATMRNMQKLAKKSPEGFVQRYGDLFSKRELAEIREPLKKGTKWEDLTDRQRDILGTGLLARLGQQQLISSASRPLAYLDHPELRWGYAMRGFALVQSDLLKVEVIDKVRAGDMVGAGESLSQYAGWVIGGYVISDTLRDVVSAGVSGAIADPFTSGPMDKANPTSNIKKELSGEKISGRFIEGVLGPLSLNTIGDRYAMGQAEKEGPVDVLFETLNPPTGFVGDILKAGAKGIGEAMNPYGDVGSVTREVMTELTGAVPVVGRELEAAMKLNEKEDYRNQMDARRRKRGNPQANREKRLKALRERYR